MTETQNNIPILHRKEWQTMTPAPAVAGTGAFIVNDNTNTKRFALYMLSTSTHYLYDHNNDAWVTIENGVFAGSVGGGSCGCYSDWSTTYTATGGTTTTITVNPAAFNISGVVVGETVEFLSGTATNIGLRRTISAIKHPGTATGTITLTLSEALPDVVANNDTFRISSGTFFVLVGAATLSATSYKKYDVATGVWTALTITGLSTGFATDARMVTPGSIGVTYDSGTADADSSTTALECDGKGWTANQWINYQVRITGGTGMGQIRVITDNDADTLTFASGVDLDDTSTFVIEGNEDAIYLIGNNAVTMYKYSISGNSWSTVSPTTARAAAPGLGASLDHVGKTGNTTWADITDIKDGRYLYSFRGGGGAVLDRFDISGGTNGAGAWGVMAYTPYITTFTTGASADWAGEHIFIAKEGSATVPQYFYKYSVVENRLIPVASDWYLNGVANLGNKLWMRYLSSEGEVLWIYNLGGTSTNLRRLMIF